MTRLTLIAVLMVVCSEPVYAEWAEVSSAHNSTFYIDPATIRRKGDMARMWMLHDYNSPLTVGGKSFLSEKILYEYDCAEETYRTLEDSQFSDNMGRGEDVYSESDPGKWEPVTPGTVGQNLWKLACGKK